MKTDMTAYGLIGLFAAYAAEYPQYIPGRVLSQEKGLYRIITEEGEQLAEVSGKFRYNAQTISDFAAVGDFVMVEDGSGGHSIIHSVLPRKSVFIRKAAGTGKNEQVVAANIDTVFICMSLNNDFNLRRLERYLSIAWDSGAVPVVVLTKSDLCEDKEEKLRETEAAAIGADVILTSSMAEDGYEKLLPYIKKGQTAALIGSSGVGKSTMINHLIGENIIETNGLRNDDKGRHTTTHRELILLENGGMVIDTPGMRELGMWDSSEGLGITFADIEALTTKCRFSNCTHGNEPGCAVRAAIESGELSEERWQSYRKLVQENAYAEDAESYLAAKEKKFKDIAKFNKANKKR